MSISSEITRIKTNIANAYTACGNKGGTLPQTQNSANLAAAISGIPSGSGIEPQQVTVPMLKEMPQRVIDEVEDTGGNEARITFPANVTMSGLQ